MIRQNQRILNVLLVVLDAVFCLLSMMLAYGLRFLFYSGGRLGLDTYMRLMMLLMPVYVLIYYACELHSSYRFKSLISEFGRIIQANFFGVSFFFVFLYLMKEVDVSRPVIFLFALFNTSFSMVLRTCLRKLLRILRKKGKNLKHFLVVGWNKNAMGFCKRAIVNKGLGCYIDGYFADSAPIEEFDEAVPCLGSIQHFDSYLQDHEVDEVVISLNYEQLHQMQHLLEVCEKEGVKANLLPFYTEYLPSRPYVEDFEGLPLINIRRIPLDSLLNRFFKRGFDIGTSLFLLLILSPLLLFLAAGVVLSSPGPILYRQKRVGRNKIPFKMYKFRSMKMDDSDKDKTAWSTRKDDRRTAFGSYLRKYSLDELPQLFNVLAGDMSLVGPRPEIPFYVEKFKEEVPLYMLKHLVRPGITGWAQVNGWRGDTSIPERIRCDIYYIENWTFLLDLKILILTAFKGVVNPNESV